MNSRRRFLNLSLVAVAAVLSAGSSVRAQVVTPIPAPTIITTVPYTITTPGYYQLGKDLVATGPSGAIIQINASNVTLDFAGHYISGPGNDLAHSLIGINANERGNLIIKNGTIAFCTEGIRLDGNGTPTSLNINQRIDNMLVSYSYFHAMVCNSARNSEVTNCRVSFTGTGSTSDALGISFAGGASNKVTKCTVTSTISTGSNQAVALYGTGGSFDALDNSINTVTSPSGTATGILGCTFAIRNTISNAGVGINGGVIQSNLTKNVASDFPNCSVADGNYGF